METSNLNMTITASIVPFLTVKNATDAIAFYTGCFGAVVTEQYETSAGGIAAGLTIGTARFWVGDEEPQFGNNAPHSNGETGVRIILTVADPDTLFDNAVRAGATQICPVTTEDSWRIGKLADPYGHIWEIGHPL